MYNNCVILYLISYIIKNYTYNNHVNFYITRRMDVDVDVDVDINDTP